jgi:hypothetical protein
MMSDLIERLLEACCDPDAVCHDCALHREAADRLAELEALVEEARGSAQHAWDTLVEINVSNYGHDDVCRMNDASVEVALSMKALLARMGGEHDRN